MEEAEKWYWSALHRGREVAGGKFLPLLLNHKILLLSLFKPFSTLQVSSHPFSWAKDRSCFLIMFTIHWTKIFVWFFSLGFFCWLFIYNILVINFSFTLVSRLLYLDAAEGYMKICTQPEEITIFKSQTCFFLFLPPEKWLSCWGWTTMQIYKGVT